MRKPPPRPEPIITEGGGPSDLSIIISLIVIPLVVTALVAAACLAYG